MNIRQRIKALESQLVAGEVIAFEQENGTIMARSGSKCCTYTEYDADRILREFGAENIAFFKGAWELED